MRLSKITELKDVEAFLKKKLYAPDGGEIDRKGLDVSVFLTPDGLRFHAFITVFGEEGRTPLDDLFDSEGLEEFKKEKEREDLDRRTLEKAFSGADGEGD
ncbi:MAG: hypothetical protein J6Y62_00890 [Clostridia bacterium]|nr:hypothetical protein [Clostridia bacterium]